MMSETRTLQQAYRAAADDVLVVRHDRPGVLFARGEDRLDLLNRMSTNELEQLPAGRQRRTVFTDPVGRTIDLVTVLEDGDRSALIGLPGRAERLRDWLQKHIFFQDQVRLELPEDEWSLWGLYGPRAGELVSELGADTPTGEKFESLEAGYLWPTSEPAEGFLLATASPDLERRLASYGGEAIDRQAFEVLRIEAGMPAPGSEILDDSIPLEVGLQPAISFTKGCYVGQEIIARMESRDRLAKQLVGLRFDGPVEPGSALQLEGRTVGTVTSVARSPSDGWIGLGSVRSRALHVEALQVEGTELAAELVELAAA